MAHRPDNREPCGDGAEARLDGRRQSRRGFLLLSLVALTGCTQQRVTRTLPGPSWKFIPDSTPRTYREPAVELPRTPPSPAPIDASVIGRAGWAHGQPVPALMQPMRPIRYVTVHHDGMRPFLYDDYRSSAGRIESIRAAHRGRGWGDIGYHYIVDRAGRVWEGRPVAWQGAHVKVANEGNIGVVALGNFDEQSPTSAQVAALERHVNALMHRHFVSTDRVRTHQEWMPTACPGRSLQRHMIYARQNGRLS